MSSLYMALERNVPPVNGLVTKRIYQYLALAVALSAHGRRPGLSARIRSDEIDDGRDHILITGSAQGSTRCVLGDGEMVLCGVWNLQ